MYFSTSKYSTKKNDKTSNSLHMVRKVIKSKCSIVMKMQSCYGYLVTESYENHEMCLYILNSLTAETIATGIFDVFSLANEGSIQEA